MPDKNEKMSVFWMGDIGEPLRHIELEPLEVPIAVPEPEKVPA